MTVQPVNMTYSQFSLHPALTEYIDAYWTATCDSHASIEKVLPDGCVDIIFNLGPECTTDGNFLIQNEKAYFVGTMTRFKETKMNHETKLLGIRFKPAAFSAFYPYASLHEVTNQTIEFEKKLAPDIQKIIQHSTAYLNHFFLQKLSKPKHILFPVIADIQKSKGQCNTCSG